MPFGDHGLWDPREGAGGRVADLREPPGDRDRATGLGRVDGGPRDAYDDRLRELEDGVLA